MCAAPVQLATSSDDQKRRVSSTDPVKVQIENLQALINNPPQNSRVIDVSPPLANYILDHLNIRNRPRKPGKISEFATDMKNGEWGLTGDTIKFSRDGYLRDGQNRLYAVVSSSETIKTHAVFGIDPRLFVRMDIGKNRNNADILAIMGTQNAGRVAQVARWLMILTSDNPKNRALSVKNDVMRSYYEEKLATDSENFQHSIEVAVTVNQRLRHPVGPIGALHYLFGKMSSVKDADRFMEEWSTGRTKRPNQKRAPTLMLQDRLQQIAADSSGRVHEAHRVGLICKAWHSWQANRSMTQAQLRFDVQSDEYEVKFTGLI